LRKYKIHIAIIAWGIFIFPVIFQPAHVVWHHSAGHNENCGDSCETSFRNPIPQNSVSISEIDDHCPICEYKFTINSLPEHLVYEIVLIGHTENFKHIFTKDPHQKLITSKSPRAPPCFSV